MFHNKFYSLLVLNLLKLIMMEPRVLEREYKVLCLPNRPEISVKLYALYKENISVHLSYSMLCNLTSLPFVKPYTVLLSCPKSR